MTEAARSPQPRTAAGRALLTNGHWDAEDERLLLPGYVGLDDLKQDILAIEAEAAQQRGGLDEALKVLQSVAAHLSGSVPTKVDDCIRTIEEELDRQFAPQPSARLTPQRKPPADPPCNHDWEEVQTGPESRGKGHCIHCGKVWTLFDAEPPADPEPRWDPQEEHCHKCGRPVGVVWTAPDDLWAAVMGTPGGIRCIRCFDEEAEAADLPLLRWVPQPADIWPIPPAESEPERLTRSREERLLAEIEARIRSGAYLTYHAGPSNLIQDAVEAVTDG